MEAFLHINCQLLFKLQCRLLLDINSSKFMLYKCGQHINLKKKKRLNIKGLGLGDVTCKCVKTFVLWKSYNFSITELHFFFPSTVFHSAQIHCNSYSHQVLCQTSSRDWYKNLSVHQNNSLSIAYFCSISEKFWKRINKNMYKLNVIFACNNELKNEWYQYGNMKPYIILLLWKCVFSFCIYFLTNGVWQQKNIYSTHCV